MYEARLRPLCLHPTFRVWLLLIQSLPSHKDKPSHLNKYHLFIASQWREKFQKILVKAPSFEFSTLLCKRTACELNSLDVATELTFAFPWGSRWTRDDSQVTGTQKGTRLWAFATSQLQVHHCTPGQPRSLNLCYGISTVQDLYTRQKGTPEPGAGLAVLCPSGHWYTLEAFRDKLPAELISATALTTTTPTLCCNRTNNLKELPVNTDATNENNNFLI